MDWIPYFLVDLPALWSKLWKYLRHSWWKHQIFESGLHWLTPGEVSSWSTSTRLLWKASVWTKFFVRFFPFWENFKGPVRYPTFFTFLVTAVNRASSATLFVVPVQSLIFLSVFMSSWFKEVFSLSFSFWVSSSTSTCNFFISSTFSFPHTCFIRTIIGVLHFCPSKTISVFLNYMR